MLNQAGKNLRVRFKELFLALMPGAACSGRALRYSCRKTAEPGTTTALSFSEAYY